MNTIKKNNNLPAEGAEPILLKHCKENKVFLTSNELHTILDAMREFAAQQQPTAEGAEEITAHEVLEKHGFKITCHVESMDIISQSFVQPIVAAMQEFATLHAQRIAEKMVEERLRDMAMGILMARDAFVRDDFDEVWHCLYKIASPNFDKIEPWDELEKIAGYVKP